MKTNKFLLFALIIIGFLAVSASQIKTVYADCGPDTCFCDAIRTEVECVSLTADCVRPDGSLYSCTIEYTHTSTWYSCGGWRYVYYPEFSYCDATDCSGGYRDNDYTEGCGSPGGGGGPPPSTFSVAMDPALRTAYPGDATTLNVTITPNSYAGTVNLDMAGTCPTNATCTFSPTSVTITDTTPQYSTLTIATNSSIAIQNYAITARGTDTVPDPDLINSASATLEVIVNPFAVCPGDGVWRDIPWEAPSGAIYPVSPGNSYSAARRSDGVYLYSEYNFSGAFTMHGLQEESCLYGYGSPVCLWMPVGISGTSDNVYSGQAYAKSPSIITGYIDKFFKDDWTGNTWKWETVGSYWDNLGMEWPAKPWNTPHSITDKDGRFWEFQITGTYPNRKAQYKCAAPAPPTCSGAGPVGWTTTATTGTHDVFAYGVSSNVTAVKFPTWGDPGGQDDIAWYPGTDMGGGTWKASVNLANHKAGDPEYGNINVHIYMDTASTPNTYCGSATFTRNPPNQPPTVPSATVTEPDYCSSFGAYVNWTYSDPDGDPQSAYQVQIDNQGSFGSPEVDSGKVSGSGTSYFASSGLAFNTTYKARVRVWDSHDSVSNWKESGSWKTPKHAYPYVDFTYTPSTDIPAKQPVQFTDQTTFYDGGGSRTWSWLFGDGGTSNVQNPPPHTYNLPGLYSSSLTATDKDNYSCSRTKQLNIAQPVPVWKEVSPR